jgi:nitrite reductase (NADH) large subunit
VHTVIIGNSAAALSALEAFRRFDASSPVTLISAEPGPAYSRVLLPYFLRGSLPYDKVFIRTPGDYTRVGVHTRFGVRVERVDTTAGRLELSGGERLAFDRLLVTTGARPTLPPIPGLEALAAPGHAGHRQAFHLWTLADARRLDAELRPGRRVLVLGSGFIALQAAWAACARGARVSVYELQARIMPTALDAGGAALLAARVREHGVELATGVQTQGFERSRAGRNRAGSVRVLARDRQPLEVDLVIVGTGVRPNVELLAGSPLAIERGMRGIPVDSRLRTTAEGIFAAGDVAAGPTAFGEAHEIHALWSTAVEHGRIAGANLAGHEQSYAGSLNMNVTEMFGLTVASMGRFGDGAELHSWQQVDSAEPRYLRICFEDDLPVGAVTVGPTDLASVLGRLRPFIRERRSITDPAAFVAGKVFWSRTSLGHFQTLQKPEAERCVS